MPVPGDGSAAGRAQYYGALSGDDKYDRLQRAGRDHGEQPARGAGSDGLTRRDAGRDVRAAARPRCSSFRRSGGTKKRLAANDPPQCPGQPASPGINNSWPKWSPQVETSGNRTYYWLIFSSWRDGGHYPTGGPIAQLYMTAITTDEINIQTNYPAVYLWNQPATSSNHTPAWDRFQIPDVM